MTHYMVETNDRFFAQADSGDGDALEHLLSDLASGSSIAPYWHGRETFPRRSQIIGNRVFGSHSKGAASANRSRLYCRTRVRSPGLFPRTKVIINLEAIVPSRVACASEFAARTSARQSAGDVRGNEHWK
jgi:hypothetical protein